MRIVMAAHAKLNLSLEVLGRRSDGYHEIVTLLQTISLHDLIAVELSANTEVAVAHGSCGPAAQNSALLALRALGEVVGEEIQAAVTIWKRIPWGAGLGGASADAAAVLRAAARLRGLPERGPLLHQAGLRVGSDVPFLLEGGTALAEGRGEKLTALAPLSGWAALAMPQERLATAQVYGALTAADLSDGHATASAAAVLGRPALEPHSGSPRWRNALQRPALEQCGSLRDLRARLGPDWLLTGSGSCLFRFAGTRDAALTFAGAAAPHAAWTDVVEMVA
jgi:4-diphosphocytidyl-2-C-methyl-D-erythritol kinase